MPHEDGVDLISQLYRTLKLQLAAIDDTPEHFNVVIDKDLWQRQVLPNGMLVEFDSFKDFIETPPPRGFGMPIGKFRELCRFHPDVLAKIDALIRENPDDLGEEKATLHNQRRLKKRLERLLNDFPHDEVLQELRNMGIC